MEFFFLPFHACDGQHCLTILIISLLTKQYLENIWRVVHQKTIYNPPSNILQIYALFQSYFQKYEKSRGHLSSRSPGMQWVNHVVSILWGGPPPPHPSFRAGEAASTGWYIPILTLRANIIIRSAALRI